MRTVSFSKTSYPLIMNDSLIIITSDQLKTANLIFLEYSKEKTINTELEKQIHNYKILYNNELIQDSLYQICIQDLSELTKQQNDTNFRQLLL